MALGGEGKYFCDVHKLKSFVRLLLKMCNITGVQNDVTYERRSKIIQKSVPYFLQMIKALSKKYCFLEEFKFLQVTCVLVQAACMFLPFK